MKLAKSVYLLRRYRKVLGGVGIVTAFSCGLFYFERYKINKFLSSLIDVNVLEINKRRPDYIYIKYHIYRESLEKLNEHKDDENWISIIIHPIGKWWKTFKHSVAWRLLNIAQNGDKHDRLKAVRQLAKIDHLKDWDFRHLAQICDARTAVSLARSECDQRWFLPEYMHGVIKNPKLLLCDIQKLINDLRPCPCVEKFFKKYFDFNFEEDADMDEFYASNTPLLRQDVDLLKECIAFLYHVTKNVEICKKVISQGGLLTLLELRKIFKNDSETQVTISKTIAQIALVKNSIQDFFASGWVGILASWMRHPDIRLQVVAAKALANLDSDDESPALYPSNIYLLYPRNRRRGQPQLDVVFIHGLLGGIFFTWRQKDKKPDELGLYGKNAFYTSETDDVFLAGEPKSGPKKNNNKTKKQAETIVPSNEPVSSITKHVKDKTSGISDVATKELVETLETATELGNEWEVVFPDCPLKSSAPSEEKYSISGDQWINDDDNEEYTYCWPMDWLPEDYPNIRVLGVDYTSAVSYWSSNTSKYCPCEKGQSHIKVRADILLDQLAQAEIGKDRPVVWVGHSMGGILCKLILLKAMESADSRVMAVAKNTKGIVFLGVPHRGSNIAKWKQHMQVILSPTIEVKELEENSPHLLELHDRFMKAIETFKNLKIVSIAEGTPTMLTSFKFPLRIVTEESAFINFGDFYILKDNHLSLSKPIFRQSFLYQRLLKVIDDSLNTPLESDENVNISNANQAAKIQTVKESFPRILYKLIRPIDT